MLKRVEYSTRYTFIIRSFIALFLILIGSDVYILMKLEQLIAQPQYASLSANQVISISNEEKIKQLQQLTQQEPPPGSLNTSDKLALLKSLAKKNVAATKNAGQQLSQGVLSDQEKYNLLQTLSH